MFHKLQVSPNDRIWHYTSPLYCSRTTLGDFEITRIVPSRDLPTGLSTGGDRSRPRDKNHPERSRLASSARVCRCVLKRERQREETDRYIGRIGYAQLTSIFRGSCCAKRNEILVFAKSFKICLLFGYFIILYPVAFLSSATNYCCRKSSSSKPKVNREVLQRLDCHIFM